MFERGREGGRHCFHCGRKEGRKSFSVHQRNCFRPPPSRIKREREIRWETIMDLLRGVMIIPTLDRAILDSDPVNAES